MTATSSAPMLNRTTFTTSRLLEFFTEKELQMQIGYEPNLWPIALIKELIDNALDACENAGIPPEITITVEDDAVTVSDNGPGMPRDTLTRSLDYLTRTSDKNYYVSPTRGQLGNALKCVWAAPFVADGEHGQVDVAVAGTRYTIDVTLDRIAQTPHLEMRETEAPDVKSGTSVSLYWKDVASSLTNDDQSLFYNNAFTLAKSFALFNPHLAIAVSTPDGSARWERSNAAWRKWAPNQPTDPHWYTQGRLAELIAAYLTADGEGRNRTVREFVSEFAGLSGTAKQKIVTEAAGLSGATLRSLVAGGELVQEPIARLLVAMQEAARPVKPSALGPLGEAHLRASLESHLCATPGTIRYAKQEGTSDSIPFIVEAAFGVHGRDADAQGRDLAVGVNWAAAVQSPLRQLLQLLGEARVDRHDPVSLVVHLASPRITFVDRGKTMIGSDQEEILAAIAKCVRSVTRSWTEAKRSEDRDHRVRQAALARMWQPEPELRIKVAAYQVMERAYLHASDDGRLPANARQIMYAARPLVLELTGGKCWSDSAYFTQTLLPDYIDSHPGAAEWTVVYDARGHFTEPHTQREIGLGTIEVQQYLDAWQDGATEIVVPQFAHEYPTVGPRKRYHAVLFVEKEGFGPLLDQAQIAERFDLAIMSTKGMSVTASRLLVDRLSQAGVTIFALHDFDKAGFSILNTLGSDTRRYAFEQRPNVVDLGLRLPDVRGLGLQSEPVTYQGAVDPRHNLSSCGATVAECDFLVEDHYGRGTWRGQRVELNAMTSPQFVTWLEEKLRAAGAQKLIPDAEALEAAYRRAMRLAELQEVVDRAAREHHGGDFPITPDLEARVQERITGSAEAWDDAVWALVTAARKPAV